MEKITHKLYDGEVEIDFYPKNHRYKIWKEFLPGVTTIIGLLDKSWPLMYWACNLARDFLCELPQDQRTDEAIAKASRLFNEKKEEAGAIGTAVHDWIELWIGRMTNGEESPPLPQEPEVGNAVIAFLDWVNAHKVKFETSERLIYSKSWWYTGTLDAVGQIDGRRYLIDFKTSNSFRPFEYGMQMAAYREAYQEETGDILNWLLGIHFDKETGEFAVYDLTNYHSECFQCFLGLNQLRKYKNPLEKKLKDLQPNPK